MVAGTSVANGQTYYENRSDIPEQYKWNFSDILKSWDDWESELKTIETKMDQITKLKGTFG
jgi:oligoendopeptidase F